MCLCMCVFVCVLWVIYGAEVHSGFNCSQRSPNETVNQTHPQQTIQPGSGSFILTTFLSISASFLLPLYFLFSQAITKVIYTCTIIQLFHTNSFHKAQKDIKIKQMHEITITWRPGLHTKLRVYAALFTHYRSFMVRYIVIWDLAGRF